MTNHQAAERAVAACATISESVAKLSKIASRKLSDQAPCPHDVELVIGELERFAILLTGTEKK